MVKVAPTIRLNSGYDFPVIGLGTYKGSSPVKIAADGEQRTTGETEKAVKDAIDAGYRHVDCALLYNNEEEVGDAIRAKIEEGVLKREDLFVTTKLWNTFHRPELVEKGCRLSLKKLGLNYLDLYLVHSPMAFKEGEEIYPKDAEGKVIYDNVNIVDVWKAMEDLVAKGLVKSIGISNFNSEQIKRIVKHAKIAPAVNQIEVTPYLTQKKLIKTCKDHGIAVAAYSPLGSPGRNKEFNLLEDPLLISIGKKYNKSAAQVILRYMVQEGLVPLPKSITKQRIIDNFNIFDFEMTPQELAQIDGLNKNMRFVQAVILKDHPEYPFDSD